MTGYLIKSMKVELNSISIPLFLPQIFHGRVINILEYSGTRNFLVGDILKTATEINVLSASIEYFSWDIEFHLLTSHDNPS